MAVLSFKQVLEPVVARLPAMQPLLIEFLNDDQGLLAWLSEAREHFCQIQSDAGQLWGSHVALTYKHQHDLDPAMTRLTVNAMLQLSVSLLGYLRFPRLITYFDSIPPQLGGHRIIEVFMECQSLVQQIIDIEVAMHRLDHEMKQIFHNGYQQRSMNETRHQGLSTWKLDGAYAKAICLLRESPGRLSCAAMIVTYFIEDHDGMEEPACAALVAELKQMALGES